MLDHFDDEGESGATTDRPALDRLVDAIVEGRIDRVVVHRLDRLTRSVLDWARIQHAFRAHGAAISVVQGDLHGTNDAITQLSGKALPDGVISRAWSHITFTDDPIASSLIAGAQHAADVGTLEGGRPDLGGLYDLTLLDQVLSAKGLPKVTAP